MGDLIVIGQRGRVLSKAANVKVGRGAMSPTQRVRLELSRPVAPKFRNVLRVANVAKSTSLV